MARKDKIVEEKTSEELKEEFLDGDDVKESVFSKIINFVLWIILIAWMAVCVTDFYRTQNEQKPKFTFKHETLKYEDGNVEAYTGLGYKIYHYNRASFKGYEFGPFWSKDRSIEEKGE